MSGLVFSLVVAAIVCWLMWRRPDARAVASGAWHAGKQQAITEFREGYSFAQKRLRAGNPPGWSPRRWASWALAAAYGGGKTLAAANRVRQAAVRGARDRYGEWRASQPVAAEVIEDIVVEPTAAPEREPPRGQDDRPPSPDPPDNTDGGNQTSPGPGVEPDHTPQEGPDMQTEAAGLISYANAHNELAAALRNQMAGSENLAASMSDVLAEHSDLIGDTAVLQDLLNQAAGIAQRISERAMSVATN